MTSFFTYRILKTYRLRGITKRDLVDKATKPHSLEYCLKRYEFYTSHNQDRATRYLLEIDDFKQPAELRAEQKGFYQISNKIITRRATKLKHELGAQNKPEFLFVHNCPVPGCKRRKPVRGQEAGFSKKGLLLHIKYLHPGYEQLLLLHDTDQPIFIKAYDPTI